MASVSTGEFRTAPPPGAPPAGAPPAAPAVAAPPVAVPPGPPAAQPSTREGMASLEEIQEARDRFDHYWMGLYDWWRQMNAEGRRRAYWTRIRVPKSRPPGPRRNPPDAPALLRVDGRRNRWRQSTRADPNNLQQYVAQVQNGGYQIMSYMRPLGFRLLKILGKGGFGMACLFEMTDVDGGKHKIVVKAGTGRDLNRERAYLRVSLRWWSCRSKEDSVLTSYFSSSAWQERDILFSGWCYVDCLNRKASRSRRRECGTYSAGTPLIFFKTS